MTPADKLQKTSGCWSKSAGNWAKRILPVYGFSKVLTLEYTGSSCNFNELYCLMQSDMILMHAIIIQCKQKWICKELGYSAFSEKRGENDNYYLWCPATYFFPFMLFYCTYKSKSEKSLELTSCHYHRTYFAACSCVLCIHI